jgi:hypothetical protein
MDDSITFAVYAVLALVVIYLVGMSGKGKSNFAVHTVRGKAPKMTPLGARLAANGWVLFTMPDCPYCEEQVKPLGAYSRVVTCAGGRVQSSSWAGGPAVGSACGNIQGYPFWANTRLNATFTGYRKPESLEKMANQTS